MRKMISVLAVTIVLSGCAASSESLQNASSGAVGCPPRAVQVSAYELGMTTSTWQATCNGETYYCSASDTLKGVRCAKAK